MSSYVESENAAAKEFKAQDKVWNAPRFFTLGFITLLVAISLIYYMSTTTGCNLEIVP
jgi:hypothetical protein